MVQHATSQRYAVMSSIIVIGNEKGGTGKSTVAIHVAIALVRTGIRVAVIDGDMRQGTIRTFLSNRRRFGEQHPETVLPSPTLIDLSKEDAFSNAEIAQVIRERGEDVVVIDTPGSYSQITDALHANADLIITPLNDSLVDLSVLADIDPNTGSMLKPNQFSEVVWRARQARAKQDGGSISWIVLRNRLSALNAHNKHVMADVLAGMEERLGFLTGPGFGERVIFRELFLQGLTLSDFEDRPAGLAWTVSHVAARQELRDLLDMVLGLLRTEETVRET